MNFSGDIVSAENPQHLECERDERKVVCGRLQSARQAADLCGYYQGLLPGDQDDEDPPSRERPIQHIP